MPFPITWWDIGCCWWCCWCWCWCCGWNDDPICCCSWLFIICCIIGWENPPTFTLIFCSRPCRRGKCSSAGDGWRDPGVRLERLWKLQLLVTRTDEELEIEGERKWRWNYKTQRIFLLESFVIIDAVRSVRWIHFVFLQTVRLERRVVFLIIIALNFAAGERKRRKYWANFLLSPPASVCLPFRRSSSLASAAPVPAEIPCWWANHPEHIRPFSRPNLRWSRVG